MNSRDKILNTLKRQIVPQNPLPEVLEGEWTEYPDPIQKFTEMISFVGGSCQSISHLAELSEALQKFEEYRSAEQIFSAIDGVPGNVDMRQISSGHELERLDFVLFPAEFGVAENGAVWVTDANVRHRVCFFITQFLVILVRKESIVHNMHQAYQRANPPRPGFGLFLSGPSKTADIEQSLVIGAHGCRELQVFVI